MQNFSPKNLCRKNQNIGEKIGAKTKNFGVRNAKNCGVKIFGVKQNWCKNCKHFADLV